MAEGKSTRQKDLNAVDLMKFIAAILIVYGHSEFSYGHTEPQKLVVLFAFCRMAVPFFFMTSGYLFYGKLISDHSGSKIPFFSDTGLKSLKRLFILYCAWSLVYFPLMAYQALGMHASVVDTISYCLRSFLYLGTSFHLWYFPALFFAIMILDVWKSRFQVKSLLLVSSFLYLVGALGDAYFWLIPSGSTLFNAFQQYFSIFVTTRNGAFLGLVFVALGAYIREKPIKMVASHTAILTMVFMCFLIAETFLVTNFTKARDHNFMILIVPVSFYLFHTLINTNLSGKISYKTLRKLSTLIYCSHIGFLTLLPAIFRYLQIEVVYENSVIRFALVYFSSLAFSMWIIKLAEHKKFGFVFRKMI